MFARLALVASLALALPSCAREDAPHATFFFAVAPGSEELHGDVLAALEMWREAAARHGCELLYLLKVGNVPGYTRVELAEPPPPHVGWTDRGVISIAPWVPPGRDRRAIVAHEVGHALGFAEHSPAGDGLMSSPIGRETPSEAEATALASRCR